MFKVEFQIRKTDIGWEWRYLNSETITDESGLSSFELNILRRIKINMTREIQDRVLNNQWTSFSLKIESIS